jgi:hypothetical protein
MTPDALKYLNDRFIAAGPRVIDLPDEPEGVYAIVGADGYVRKETAERPPIQNVAYDIDTLCRAVIDSQGEEPADPKDEEFAEIWYSRNGVVALYDRNQPDSRGSRCTLTLSPSPQLAMLQKWEQHGGATIKQSEFVLLLRTMFAGCGVDGLLPIIRGVKATRGAEVSSQIQQGKVSMNKSIVAEMSGTAAIPEQAMFWVPMFAQAAVQNEQRVRIAIDPQPETEAFRLIVLPGDIEKAQADAEEALAKSIKAALGDGCTIPVFRGTP